MKLKISVGPYVFDGKLESNLAPRTSGLFANMLPFESQVVHVRWSGEGVWIPFGDRRFDVPYENATSHPAPGQFILYPGGISESEFLLAYGGVDFSSKVGQLAGNHFLSLTGDLTALPELGKLVLWSGAQSINFRVDQ